MNASSPGHVVGPKTCRFRAMRKCRGRTGNQRVRVLVVEKFEKQTSVRRIGGACPATRCKTRRRERCLARRKPTPRSRRYPDDGGRWREGEDGAQVPRRVTFIGSAGGKDVQAAMLVWARYGVRRSGSYARRPLNGVADTETLGFWVNPGVCVLEACELRS